MAGGFHNLKSVTTKLFQVTEAGVEAAAKALKAEADRVMARSQELVPRATGELAESAFVDEPRREGDQTWVAIGYTAGHAVPVHELLHHHHEQGQAKYLQTAVAEASPGMPRRVAEIVDRAMRDAAR